jgi:hypothetical protein
VPSIIAALADGSAAEAIGLAAVVGAEVAAGAVVAPALEQAPTKAAAMRRPAKAPVRLRLFTCSLLCGGPGSTPGAVGWLTARHECPDDV